MEKDRTAGRVIIVPRPETAVSEGAAILGAYMTNTLPKSHQEAVFRDRVPTDIWLWVDDDSQLAVFRQGSVIPAKTTLTVRNREAAVSLHETTHSPITPPISTGQCLVPNIILLQGLNFVIVAGMSNKPSLNQSIGGFTITNTRKKSVDDYEIHLA